MSVARFVSVRSRSVKLYACISILLGLFMQGAAAQSHTLLFEGTFLDITFPNGNRVTREMKVKLYRPAEQGMARRSPARSYFVITEAAHPQAVTRYDVASAFDSTGASVYLGTRGSAAAVLYLPSLPNARKPGQFAVTAQLLFSNSDFAHPVRGTYFLRPLPPHVHRAGLRCSAARTWLECWAAVRAPCGASCLAPSGCRAARSQGC